MCVCGREREREIGGQRERKRYSNPVETPVVSLAVSGGNDHRTMSFINREVVMIYVPHSLDSPPENLETRPRDKPDPVPLNTRLIPDCAGKLESRPRDRSDPIRGSTRLAHAGAVGTSTSPAHQTLSDRERS